MTTRVRLWGFGGAGINNVLRFEGNQEFNNVSITVADSSERSNLPENVTADVYVLDNMDGAGKNRSFMNEKAAGEIPRMLDMYKPSQLLNVVVFGMGGGTGSVLGPLLVNELLSRNEPVICICVAGAASVKELDNTIKTMMTLGNYAKRNNKPVAMFYVEPKTRKSADDDIYEFIRRLLVISNQNLTREFDRQDLFNFINYPLVTSLHADIGIIGTELNQSESDPSPLNKPGNTVIKASSILITKDENEEPRGMMAEYAAKCIVTDPTYTDEDVRFDMYVGLANIYLAELKEQLEKVQVVTKTTKVTYLETTDTEDGMVL